MGKDFYLLNPTILRISYTAPLFPFPDFSFLPPLPCFITAMDSPCVFKMALFHTMEYYSVTKGNEVLIHAIPQMNPENLMLSERSLTQRGTYCKIPLHAMFRKGKSTSSPAIASAGDVGEERE